MESDIGQGLGKGRGASTLSKCDNLPNLHLLTAQKLLGFMEALL